MNQEHFDRIQTLKLKGIRNRDREYLNETRFREWLDNKRRQEYKELTKGNESEALFEKQRRKDFWVEILLSILLLSVGFFIVPILA